MYAQHGGAMVSAVVSQQEGPWFKMPALVLSYFGFLSSLRCECASVFVQGPAPCDPVKAKRIYSE